MRPARYCGWSNPRSPLPYSERACVGALDMLPSATQTASAPGNSFLSRLNGWPTRTPADASRASSRMHAHGSGSIILEEPRVRSLQGRRRSSSVAIDMRLCPRAQVATQLIYITLLFFTSGAHRNIMKFEVAFTNNERVLNASLDISVVSSWYYACCLRRRRRRRRWFHCCSAAINNGPGLGQHQLHRCQHGGGFLSPLPTGHAVARCWYRKCRCL
jgi:hypothetical protein